jgi:hypothetical protein
VDWFDFIPIVPPDLPGQRAPALTPAQRFAAGAAGTALTTLNFALVLLVGFARHTVIGLAVMPVASATLAFAVGRRVATPIAWAIVIAMGTGAFCFIGNGCALLLHGLAQLFNELG